MTKPVERWGMGQEADTAAVKCPSCLDLDLSQRSYSEEPGGPGDTACPPAWAIHTRLPFYYCSSAI